MKYEFINVITIYYFSLLYIYLFIIIYLSIIGLNIGQRPAEVDAQMGQTVKSLSLRVEAIVILALYTSLSSLILVTIAVTLIFVIIQNKRRQNNGLC